MTHDNEPVSLVQFRSLALVQFYLWVQEATNMQGDAKATTGSTKHVDVPLDSELVHRILLLDASRLDSLQTKSPNLTFAQFHERIMRDGAPEYVMKRAFLDHVKDSILINHNWHPVHNLLLELHTSIRSLVPNRPDLHSILQDPSFQDTQNTNFRWEEKTLLAARALAQLESEVRSQPTLDWIHRVEESPSTSKNANTSNHHPDPSFLIASILYFIDKAELCAKEKRDFYLTKVIAPRLLSSGEGFELERNAFRTRFSFSPPVTQKWIEELAISMKKDEVKGIQSSAKERRLFIITRWIDSILFETEQEKLLPEIFALDVEALRSIRKSTRAAAAGCSLGWHACQAANRSSTDTLLQDELQGASLVQAMNSVGRYSTIEDYEHSVADCLIGLAQTWNGGAPLQPSVIERLRGQTISVLRGEDPVLKLLDERMKKVFVTLAKAFVDETAPISMQTGFAMSHVSRAPDDDSSFVSCARLEICRSGLAFYARDLAITAERAVKVGDLAYKLYADEFLDKMILDAAKRHSGSEPQG